MEQGLLALFFVPSEPQRDPVFRVRRSGSVNLKCRCHATYARPMTRPRYAGDYPHVPRPTGVPWEQPRYSYGNRTWRNSTPHLPKLHRFFQFFAYLGGLTHFLPEPDNHDSPFSPGQIEKESWRPERHHGSFSLRGRMHGCKRKKSDLSPMWTDRAPRRI